LGYRRSIDIRGITEASPQKKNEQEECRRKQSNENFEALNRSRTSLSLRHLSEGTDSQGNGGKENIIERDWLGQKKKLPCLSQKKGGFLLQSL